MKHKVIIWSCVAIMDLVAASIWAYKDKTGLTVLFCTLFLYMTWFMGKER